MGRANPDQFSDQPPPSQPQDGYTAANDHHQPPPPAAYPPQQPPPAAAYPPQPPPPEVYPPEKPAAYPPPQEAVAFPPPSPQPPAPANYPGQPGTSPYHQQNQQQQVFRQQAVYGGGQMGYQQPAVMSAPEGIPVANQYLAPTNGWSSDLFACMDDPENAIVTACFPCVTFGQIAEIVDNGQTTCATSGLLYGVIAAFIGIPCIMSCSYRTKIRNRYGLMETPAPDWITHCFCEWCALCQEYRELKARGMDPAIGWQGNLMKNQQMHYPAMTPPTNQTMMG